MTNPPPDVVERIRHKKSQYTRFADTKQWDRFDTIFAPDATLRFCDADGETLTMPGPDGPDGPPTQLAWSSSAAWAAFYERVFDGLQAIHQIGVGEFEEAAEGPDEVRAVFSVVYHAGAKGDDGKAGTHQTGGGHYYETWVRRDGDWFCKDLVMQRSYHRTV